MGSRAEPASHWSWNRRYQAPHPHEPDALEAICSWSRWGSGERKETPFQLTTNYLHHWRSDRKDLFSLIGCGLSGWCRTPFMRSIMRRRNERPEQTTLYAWCNNPTRDSSSLCPHVLLHLQSSRRALRRCSLSLGRRSCEEAVSTSMPRNVRQEVGPSRLCSASGTPRVKHACVMMARASAHSEECGGPTTIKSSR